MITLKDSIEVDATPEEVFNWLVQRLLDKESYQAWGRDILVHRGDVPVGDPVEHDLRKLEDR
jgi:hypothetical protein